MGSTGFHLEGESTPIKMLFKELWRSRELMAILARKEFFVQYRRATLGLLWAVGLPLFQAIVLGLVFSRFARVRTPGVPYLVFLFAGTAVWGFFSPSVSGGSTSIVAGSDMTTKIYFPRAILPLTIVATNLYGYAITLAILLGMCVVTGVGLGVHTLLLIPAVILTTALAAGFGLVFGALYVYFRDIRYIVAALMIAWFYVTPIIYPLRLVGSLATWLRLNPLTGLVELTRAATVGAEPGWVTSLWWTIGWVVVLFMAAVLLYRRFDRVFVDLL